MVEFIITVNNRALFLYTLQQQKINTKEFSNFFVQCFPKFFWYNVYQSALHVTSNYRQKLILSENNFFKCNPKNH